jgi:hypothetical protein
MIDWMYVAANALWICGAAVVLAAISFHVWRADEAGQPYRLVFRSRSWRLYSSSGMALVCAGVLLGQPWAVWARVLCGLAGLWFAWMAIRTSKPDDDSRVSTSA